MLAHLEELPGWSVDRRLHCKRVIFKKLLWGWMGSVNEAQTIFNIIQTHNLRKFGQNVLLGDKHNQYTKCDVKSNH